MFDSKRLGKALKTFADRKRLGPALRTFTITKNSDLPENAKTFHIEFQPREKTDPALIVVILSICAMFLITRLDAVSKSDAVHSFIVTIFNWGTLYTPF